MLKDIWRRTALSSWLFAVALVGLAASVVAGLLFAFHVLGWLLSMVAVLCGLSSVILDRRSRRAREALSPLTIAREETPTTLTPDEKGGFDEPAHDVGPDA